MKRINIIIVTGLVLTSTVIFAQDLLESQVPSLILNKFKSNYPNAFDVEWEKHGKYYEVDFDTQSNLDYEIWYNSIGEVIRQKEDIQNSSLPNEIKNSIAKNYKYQIDDIDKISEKSYITYVVELKKSGSEIQITFDKKGKELSKRLD